MLLDVDYKLLDPVPSTEWANFDFLEFPWTSWIQNYKVHPETLSYQVLLSNTKIPNSEVKILSDPDNQILINLVLDECTKLEEHYNGKTIQAILICLPAGTSSLPNINKSKAFEDTHRCFLPIRTNIDAKISINNNEYHFDIGNWYEMNNLVEHQTFNHGKEDMIHLILDILPD